jgi:hypothetical protein
MFLYSETNSKGIYRVFEKQFYFQIIQEKDQKYKNSTIKNGLREIASFY